jgi:hypothetical protein
MTVAAQRWHGCDEVGCESGLIHPEAGNEERGRMESARTADGCTHTRTRTHTSTQHTRTNISIQRVADGQRRKIAEARVQTKGQRESQRACQHGEVTMAMR